jgi:Nitrile hydratase beta subunit
MSYCEKWFAALVELLVKSDLVTDAEVESGKPAPSSTKGIPPLIADKVLPLVARGNPASRDVVVVPHHWLAALEHLLTAKGLANPEALLARKEAWAEAYRRTPHGKPVELAVGSGSPDSR